MTTWRLTPAAQQDLIAIRRFTLERWGQAQSLEYLSGLRRAFRLLAENPAMGRNRPDPGDEVVSFPYESHIIYYWARNQELVVIGVLHKRMVPEAHLADRGTVG